MSPLLRRTSLRWLLVLACALGPMRASAYDRFAEHLSRLGLGPRYEEARVLPDGKAWEALPKEKRAWLVSRLQRIESLEAWLRESVGDPGEKYVVQDGKGRRSFTPAGQALLISLLSEPPRRENAFARPEASQARRELMAGLSEGTRDLGAAPRSAAFFDGTAQKRGAAGPAVAAAPAPAGDAAGAPVAQAGGQAARPQGPVKVDSLAPDVAVKIESLTDGELLMLQQSLEDSLSSRWQNVIIVVGGIAGIIFSVYTGNVSTALLLAPGLLASIIALVANEQRIRNLRARVGRP